MLTQTQIDQYHTDGFLILDNIVSLDALQAVRDEVDGIVDGIAKRLYDAGKLNDLCADEPFERRLTALEAKWPGIATLVHIRGVLEPALASLWSDPLLLDVAEQLVGPEVAGHPVWNLRSKTPDNALATVPWHQDCAYLGEASQDTLQVTAWVPLVDATHEMGCLQVVRGGHRHGVRQHRLEQTHGDQRSWYLDIQPQDLPEGEIVTCEIPAGSVLLLNQLIPHRSTENRSDQIRWSVDLRWQDPRLPSGFEAKDPILMRTAANPDHVIDWRGWAGQNRIADAQLVAVSDEFDTTVTGPWLDRWR